MDTNLQSNLSIDFKSKNNRRPMNNRTPRRRTTNDKLSSEAFLRHLKTDEPKKSVDPLKLIKKGEKPVRIWALLGLEQVGQCIFIEYENDMIIIDAGMEFASKDNFWADYIIPDISYIKRNKKKLRGIIITHGHLDHVGALKDILPDLWFPMIYTTPLSLGIIKKTFDDPKEAEKVKYKIIDPDRDLIKLGCFTLEFIPVNHNIPETLAVAIHTPKGTIFDSADFKIDHTPSIDRPADLPKIARIWVEWVKLYIGDSLWSDKQWRSISEKTIWENLDEIIKNSKSRILIATFASNIGRIIQIIKSAIKYNRVIFLSGRSMVNNVEICQNLGYINVPKGYIKKLNDEAESLPDDKVLILSTGAQGEEFAALTRMARNEHNFIQLKSGDQILMSASPIPGNESSVNNMINNLVVKDVNLMTNDAIDIHASGHGCIEDHKLLLSLLKPEFVYPYFMPARERYAHKKIAVDMWVPESNILMPLKNGSIIEMYDDTVMVSKDKIKLDTILVDGKGKGHLSGEYVIKARSIMANDGVLSLIFKIDTSSKQLVGNIQIESRWFVYSSEVKEIHTKIVEFARSKYATNLKKRMDTKNNLRAIKDELEGYITQIIGRVPMIMPMFVYINKSSAKADVSKDESIVGMTLEEQGYDE